MIKNRTLFTGDNLPILRGMKDQSVDLIYLDPPFNSNANYAAPIGSAAAGAEFKDTWGLSDIDKAWHGEIADKHQGLYDLLSSVRQINGDSMMSYLIYMVVRIMELHRILKDTGSLYLHCDPTASHYLKLLLDDIFGAKNFRNEIVWCYRGAGYPKKDFGRRHDIIFRYSLQNDYVFNLDDVREEYALTTQERFKHYIGNRRKGKDFGEQTLNKLGRHPDDWWQIQPIAPSAKERVGYPTQKPLALLKKIIKASSNEGDMVLDPFCGCATSCVASEILRRKWIGIDISKKALELVNIRLHSELAVGNDDDPTLFWKVIIPCRHIVYPSVAILYS